MRRNTIFVLVLSMALCGCGTVDNMMGIHGGPTAYGGVRQDFRDVKGGNPVAALDVPLSAVGDTITLPASLARSASKSR